MTSFDRVIDRTKSYSSRWTEFPAEVLAMTTGDVDFAIPPPVRDALAARLDEGIFGYDSPPAALTEIICARYQRLYGWAVKPEWLVYLPGVVPGLNMACRAFAGPSGGVITETPVYYPFLYAPGNMGKTLIEVLVLLEGGRWVPDYARMEQAASEPDTSLLLLCNPQNPTGRVASKDELTRLADLCLRHNLVICSDEIHAEILFDGKQHLPIAALSPEVSQRTITLTSHSKAFAVNGLGGAFAIIENDQLRRQFALAGRGLLSGVNDFAIVAMMAAYTQCDDWFDDFLSYLKGNRELLNKRLSAMPGLATVLPEATFFQWLDFRASGLNDPKAALLDAGVALSDGAKFGQAGFLRLNYATPRTRLQEALDRIEQALPTG